MDGVYDLGGLDGFGVVRLEGSDRVASEPWELRAHALALLAAGESLRPWIERLPPAIYLSTPYFARWLLAIEDLLVDRGDLRAGEVDQWQDEISTGDHQLPRRTSDELSRRMDELMTTAADLPAPVAAKFTVGDLVSVTRSREIQGVCRRPRYTIGAIGRVETICGAEVPLDRPRGAPVETVYTVAFTSTDLWGEGSEPSFTVHVDLTEHYLTGADHG